MNINRPAVYLNFIIIILISLFSGSILRADTHFIKASNYEFNPANITVAVGDTIVWQWEDGKHTTTSSKIPDGAATWDSEIKSSNKTYTYVVTVPGEYDYVCTPHLDMGMTGIITAVASKTKGNLNEKGANGQGYNEKNSDSYFSGPSFDLISKDSDLLVACFMYSYYYKK